MIAAMNKIVHLFLLFSIVAAKHFLLETEDGEPKWGHCFKEKNGYITHHGLKKLDGCQKDPSGWAKWKPEDCHKGYTHDTMPYDLRKKWLDCGLKDKNVEENDDDFDPAIHAIQEACDDPLCSCEKDEETGEMTQTCA